MGFPPSTRKVHVHGFMHVIFHSILNKKVNTYPAYLEKFKMITQLNVCLCKL